MTKTEAKKYGVHIGRLTSQRDSQGEYTLYEDNVYVASGWYDSAAELKSDYIQRRVSDAAGCWDDEEAA